MQKKETEYIGARIEKNLKKEFEEAAQSDTRSVSNALIVAIKDYIEKITGKPA